MAYTKGQMLYADTSGMDEKMDSLQPHKEVGEVDQNGQETRQIPVTRCKRGRKGSLWAKKKGWKRHSQKPEPVIQSSYTHQPRLFESNNGNEKAPHKEAGEVDESSQETRQIPVTTPKSQIKCQSSDTFETPVSYRSTKGGRKGSLWAKKKGWKRRSQLSEPMIQSSYTHHRRLLERASHPPPCENLSETLLIQPDESNQVMAPTKNVQIKMSEPTPSEPVPALEPEAPYQDVTCVLDVDCDTTSEILTDSQLPSSEVSSNRAILRHISLDHTYTKPVHQTPTSSPYPGEDNSYSFCSQPQPDTSDCISLTNSSRWLIDSPNVLCTPPDSDQFDCISTQLHHSDEAIFKSPVLASTPIPKVQSDSPSNTVCTPPDSDQSDCISTQLHHSDEAIFKSPVLASTPRPKVQSDSPSNTVCTPPDSDQSDCIPCTPQNTMKSSLIERDNDNVFNKFTRVQSGNSIVTYILLHESGSPTIKLSVTIKENFGIEVTVGNKILDCNHDLWLGLPKYFNTWQDVKKLLCRILCFDVCIGNPDDKFTDLLPLGSGFSLHVDAHISAYHEACPGGTSTIRSIKCEQLVQRKQRCCHCQLYRGTLRKKVSNKNKSASKENKNPLSSTKAHSVMSKQELVTKVIALRKHSSQLMVENEALRKRINHLIEDRGVILNPDDNDNIQKMVDSLSSNVNASFPDDNNFPKLFWQQQQKFNSIKNKSSMKWHPMIIRWCIYLKSKSAKGYAAMRHSEFISLPSERTLCDYTNYMPAKHGFQPYYMDKLIEEARAVGSYGEAFKSYVGILQDEIKIKDDLVYDKHTGELVGYINIDNFGNQLNNIESYLGKAKRELATHVLVLMVRGVATDLRFPLASFATKGVTSDALYTILWECIQHLELYCNLKVLFITCDGATPNRRFFRLHRLEDGALCHSTDNVYALDERKVYFISDAPHLIKTTRNCFSNSYSHKMTRKLWKDGKDISWMQIVDLYTRYVEANLYGVTNKLTRAHIDMNAFNQMKVNLAAQILSSSVANALETYYGAHCSETVKFLRHMNRFFDCLNGRGLSEGKKKRNPDLNAYSTTDDPRLDYLLNDFLQYFEDWESSVLDRPGPYSKGQRAAMMLSYQTLEGLKITVHSIVACIRTMLNKGAPFVLTSHFNQDPLEGFFGHCRHKGGANDNPTVRDIKYTINNLRVVGSQTTAPVRGNVKRNRENPVIDDTPLPKRHKPNNN